MITIIQLMNETPILFEDDCMIVIIVLPSKEKR